MHNITDKIDKIKFDYIDEIFTQGMQKENNFGIFCLLRKTKSNGFKVPIQKIYAGKSIKTLIRKKLNIRVPGWLDKSINKNFDMHNLFLKTERFLK